MSKTWKAKGFRYPRTRYKSTAWRKDAWAFLKKKNNARHYGSFLRNALERTRANREAKNSWAKHYHPYRNVPIAKGSKKAINAQADWRWRNRNVNWELIKLGVNPGVFKR